MAKKVKRDYINTKNMDLPARFEPHFLDDADGRCVAVKELRRRLERLKTDAAIDSYQKQIIAQRCVFLTARLETQEVVAAQGGRFDAGCYVQAVNCLIGLLKCLGLQRQAREVVNLRTYVESKQKQKQKRKI